MATATQDKPKAKGKEAEPEQVTFWAIKSDGYQFFFKNRKAKLFHTAGGHERFKRHKNSVAKFQPIAPGSGGFYTTSDPREIAELRACPDLVVVQ